MAGLLGWVATIYDHNLRVPQGTVVALCLTALIMFRSLLLFDQCAAAVSAHGRQQVDGVGRNQARTGLPLEVSPIGDRRGFL